MCQVTSSATSTSRRNDVIIAAKGFVLGASVVASLFVLEDVVSSNGQSAKSLRLRGSPDANASPTTNPVLHSSVEQDFISEPKESNNGILVANTRSPHDEVISYVPSAAPSTPIPTYMPTAADEVPTDMRHYLSSVQA